MAVLEACSPVPLGPWPYGRVDKIVAGPEDGGEVDDDT